MNQDTPKFHYDIKTISVLATKLGTDPSAWVIEQMNDLGSRGIRILAPPIQFNENSTFTGPNGPIPYFGIAVFTEELYYGTYTPPVTIEQDPEPSFVADEEPPL